MATLECRSWAKWGFLRDFAHVRNLCFDFPVICHGRMFGPVIQGVSEICLRCRKITTDSMLSYKRSENYTILIVENNILLENEIQN
jgi:hypothetical protein